MKHRIYPVSILILIFLLPLVSGAQQILQHSNREIIIEFTPEELTLENARINGQPYTLIRFSDSNMLTLPGAPMIPYWEKKVAIPPGVEVRSDYTIQETENLANINILPAVAISGRETLMELDSRIYEQSQPFPGDIIEISPPKQYRGYRVVTIKVFPVQYSPQAQTVQIIKKLKIRLSFQGTPVISRLAKIRKEDDNILSAKILNFSQARQWSIAAPNRLQKLQVNYDFSQGQWYKIPVTEEGIYTISGAFLKSKGIDISTINPATIQMFNYGGKPLPYSVNDPRPQDLNEIAIEVQDLDQDGVMDEGDFIRFYGRGVSGWEFNSNRGQWVSYNHPYDVQNYYIFTFNQNVGKRIAQQNSLNQAGAQVAVTFTDHYRFEEDRYNILKSGPDWYWLILERKFDEKTLDFNLPQNISAGPLEMFFYFKGGSGSRYGDNKSYRDTIDVYLNGSRIIDNITIYRNQWRSKTLRSGSLQGLKGGKNQLKFIHTANLDGAFAYLDYFTVSFERPFIAENDYLKFYYMVGTSPVEFQISNFIGNENHIWDVTQFDNVTEIIPIQNGKSVTFQAQENTLRPKQFIAWGPGAEKSVSDLLPIQNSPNLRDPSRKGKLLIITHPDFYEASEALENLRETQFPNPLETERVTVDEIYREFSSCVQDPTAIRNFLMYAYSNWSVPPEYVLLLGDGSYDYKKIELKNYINRIPLFEIAGSEEIGSRESDHYFVDFSMTNPSGIPTDINPYPSFNDLDPWIAIGRAPINNLTELEIFLQKQQSYQQSYLITPDQNGWQSILTFVADDEFGPPGFENEWFHMRDTETLIRRYIPHKFDLKKIYLTDYPTQAGGLGRSKPKAAEDLMNQINQGTLLINFVGHGDPDTWAHEQILVRSRDLPLIANDGKLPFWVAATCDWGKFDDPNHNSMAEEMIWLNNRGGIGVLSSSRPVYASANAAFLYRFYRNLFRNSNNAYKSDLIGNALVKSLGGGQNDQKYRLLGDPTLQLADPQYQVRLTSIEPDTIKALSTVTIKAQILNDKGELLSNFQGDALIRVFDVVDSMSANNNNIRYTYQKNLIFKGIVEVKNGVLQGQFIVPKSIKYKKSPTGRISIYAWDDNLGDAVGFVDTLLIYGTESQIADNRGPEIEFTFEDQPDFIDGDYVSRQPTIVVRLFDEQGINLTQEVGHRIELTIDGKIKKDVTAFFVYDKNSFQSGKLRYTLPALEPGAHTIQIIAWDNLNNFSEQQINFRTTTQNQLVLEDVLNYPNPFSTDTYFTFQFQSPNGSGDVKIKIYTVTGRLIQELEGIATPGFNRIYWDGRDRNGDILANGVYLYKIIIDDGDRRIEKLEKLAVLR